MEYGNRNVYKPKEYASKECTHIQGMHINLWNAVVQMHTNLWNMVVQMYTNLYNTVVKSYEPKEYGGTEMHTNLWNTIV